MLTKQTLTLTDNLLICESEYVKSELKWKAVQRIVPAKNYVFLYLSELGAMLVPKRAFDSKDQWENFIQYCTVKTQENSK
ncbi:MAG TPA: YcxB family protein [Anaerolineales bacterium]|nr:YcxB family protein [Anaerolineales bacterium]